MGNLAGQHIKGYELQERIAAGGFGAIYRAHQSAVGREVAVKVILPGLANRPDFIRRFEAEAQLIARLEHMNIVPLYDYWRDPYGAYLVMRFLRGGSLHDHIRKQGALSIEEALNLLSQVAQGLHVAHRNQVIHRDIKPSNILLDEDGNGYLGDFGIAKDYTTTQSITEPDGLIGSPKYLAPEQARSEPVTPQTDIYSLGVVLYEMLSGEHPFPGLEKIANIFKHLNDPLPQITTLDENIRDAVNDVIQKSTAKDPKQRFIDVIEMVQALRQAARLDVMPTPTSLVELLTPREQEVMQLIVDGKTNREIADILVLTEGTVKQYITSIYRKLRVRSRVQAIARARDLNFVVKKPTTTVAVSTGLQPEPENPYKGLRAFQAADAQDFFGRERLIQKLLGRLQDKGKHRRFLAMVGPSGSGKSSVVKAGLIPALWHGDLPGSENWYVVDMLPGAHPIEDLEVALLRVADDRGLNVREQLERDARGLLRAAQLILPDDGSQLLLVIDQFEEVFTLVESEGERRQLLDLLRQAVGDDRSRVRVVVTLRADHYDRPLEYPDFGELIRSRVETVLPLSAEELERAISEPANRVGVAFEDGLVSRIVSDVHYQPGALPLLQYALTELFERRDDHTLTQAAYTEIGGTGGALANRADEIYLESSNEGQELIRQLFLRLVTLGEGAEDTRRRASRHELLSLIEDTDLMDELIDTYAEYRLLSLDHDPASRKPTVEVAHEAILREWERLREWLSASREDVRQQRAVARAAGDWDTNNRDASYLLHGARLEQVETWRELSELALTPLETEFIAASMAQRERQQAEEWERQEREARLERRSRNFLRALVAVFAVAAVLSGGFGIFAVNQRDEALRQASIGLAAQAIAQLDSDAPERGVLLALVALEEYPYTPQAESALAQTVYGTHQYMTLPTVSNRVTSIEFSTDGELIAGSEWDIVIWDSTSGKIVNDINTGSKRQDDITGLDWFSDSSALLTASQELGVVTVWDTTTGEALLHYEAHEGAVNSVYASADNRLALSASADMTAHIWNTRTGETLQIFAGHEGEVNDAIWSPDERKVATASRDGTIRLWDIKTGEELMRIDAHLGGVTALSWSSDGARIASAGNDGLGRVWNAETGELLFTLIGHDATVRDIAWSPDDSLLATASGDGSVRVWESVTGTEQLALTGADTEGGDVSWSLDGKRVAVSGDAFPRVWDISTPIVHLVGHTAGENAFIQTNWPYWSPDSSWVGTGGNFEDTYRFWDPVTGENIRTFEGVLGGFGSPNPAGTEIFLVNPPRIVDLNTGDERLVSVPQEIGDGFAIEWSADGSLFTLQSPVPIYPVYDAETLELLFTGNRRDCGFLFPAVFSPDNKYLAHTCFGEFTSVLITETLTGRVVQELKGHTDSTNIARWSPDGTKLATTSADLTVRIWDVETGETLTVFTGHAALPIDVDWSPDGTRLVSGDTGGTVLIWDAETGGEVNRYNVGGSTFFQKWSPDGTRVLTTGFFDAPDIRPVWQSTEDLIAYAYNCCVFRELTPEERGQFGLPKP